MWYFAAHDLRLDPNTGRGTVKKATLRVADVPVLYVPYFNFPIDSRRMTGLLVPRFGSTNDGGFDFSNRFISILHQTTMPLLRHAYYRNAA